MNKENNRSAAGLRRSAIAERLRLREEWSALKGIDVPTTSRQGVLSKKTMNAKCTPGASRKCQTVASNTKVTRQSSHGSSEVLRGVVALVDVGAEPRALPLRAALAALGASVVNRWSPLVTHLIWADGGCRATRAKGRALGCRLVAPLWVQACAAAGSRLRERSFPTASRHSDLPSPRTLRQLLKRAEMENIPLVDLLSDSKEESKEKLRLSTDSEQNTSADKTTDTSNDTIDVESRVNTAPRRALPNTSASVDRPTKSRRKLFTQKEAEILRKNSDDDSDITPSINKSKRRIQGRQTQRDKRDLVRAERMAKKILASCTTQEKTSVTQTNTQYRIVLTGMSRSERQITTKAILDLKGRTQKHVTKRTTHVLLGSCRNDNAEITGVTSHDITSISKNNDNRILANNNGKERSGNTVINNCYLSNNNGEFADKKARTLNALQGAARGCRVLHSRWAVDSAAAGKWLHHHGYEVHHLRKICQKARVERTALGRTHSEYSYDVFNGIRVCITPNAEQKDAATQLLKLCGAIVHESEQNGGHTRNGGHAQDGGRLQNGGRPQNDGNSDCDIVIGTDVGEISSKWVFDSVAAARMRTTRKYINIVGLNNR